LYHTVSGEGNLIHQMTIKGMASAFLVVFSDAVLVTTNIQIPTTLRPSRTKFALVFLMCLLFVLGGIWMVRDGDPMGYFCAGVFAVGLPVCLLQLHPKAGYLHLAPDGFTYCGLFRAHTVRWGHVCEFAVMRVSSIWMVGWNFTPDYRPPGRARAISKSLYGCEGALPDTYGMKPQELADLMETLRQRYAEARNA
jgi:hypothetical protein